MPLMYVPLNLLVGGQLALAGCAPVLESSASKHCRTHDCILLSILVGQPKPNVFSVMPNVFQGCLVWIYNFTGLQLYKCTNVQIDQTVRNKSPHTIVKK